MTKQRKPKQALSIGVGLGPRIGIQEGPLWAACSDGIARAVGAGRDCGDGASAGYLIVVAALEAPTVITGLDDIAMVSQAIQ